MTTVLTSRQVRTVEWLLAQTEPRSVEAAASDLRLSPRVVRSGLDGVTRWLAAREIELVRKRGVGIWLDGTPEAIAAVRGELGETKTVVRVSTPSERRQLLRLDLLSHAPESRTLPELTAMLDVSATSTRRDIDAIEDWFEFQGLFLVRRGGDVGVVGNEQAIRKSMVKLLLEAVPVSYLRNPSEAGADPAIAVGIRAFLDRVPLAECRRIIVEAGLADAGGGWLAADLGITAMRLREGRALTMEGGALRSMQDHPVWETAAAMGEAIERDLGIRFADAEVAGLTELLLGIAALAEPTVQEPDPGIDELLDRCLAIATELHPGLDSDEELREGLRGHIGRLRVRIRYGLPVHNPLLAEVARRFPDAHEVAMRITNIVAEHDGEPLTEDEAGFITMYLSGALERRRLRPRVRAVVVCPAGMATAWILVNRIQSEFPELDLVDVLAAQAIAPDQPVDADLVISTIPLELSQDTAVVVVSPFLGPADVRSIAAAL